MQQSAQRASVRSGEPRCNVMNPAKIKYVHARNSQQRPSGGSITPARKPVCQFHHSSSHYPAAISEHNLRLNLCFITTRLSACNYSQAHFQAHAVVSPDNARIHFPGGTLARVLDLSDAIHRSNFSTLNGQLSVHSTLEAAIGTMVNSGREPWQRDAS
jgi:hypothetical protein